MLTLKEKQKTIQSKCMMLWAYQCDLIPVEQG